MMWKRKHSTRTLWILLSVLIISCSVRRPNEAASGGGSGGPTGVEVGNCLQPELDHGSSPSPRLLPLYETPTGVRGIRDGNVLYIHNGEREENRSYVKVTVHPSNQHPYSTSIPHDDGTIEQSGLILRIMADYQPRHPTSQYTSVNFQGAKGVKFILSDSSAYQAINHYVLTRTQNSFAEVELRAHEFANGINTMNNVLNSLRFDTPNISGVAFFPINAPIGTPLKLVVNFASLSETSQPTVRTTLRRMSKNGTPTDEKLILKPELVSQTQNGLVAKFEFLPKYIPHRGLYRLERLVVCTAETGRNCADYRTERRGSDKRGVPPHYFHDKAETNIGVPNFSFF